MRLHAPKQCSRIFVSVLRAEIVKGGNGAGGIELWESLYNYDENYSRAAYDITTAHSFSVEAAPLLMAQQKMYGS